MDADLDTDVDTEGGTVLGKFSRVLSDGEAPFTVALSFFAFLMWGMMMTLNHFFNPASVWAIGMAIMAASLAVALFITRAIMRFLSRLIRKIFGITPQNESFIDAIGVVITSEVTETFGQIEVYHDGVPCRFSVDLFPGSEPLIKGDYAKIVRKGRKGKTYLVVKTVEEPSLPKGNSK
ncbi:hypothetical protein [Cerasicoccus arenae]|nr:hypothetical protein [Cerasicoccus arenae]